MNTAPDPRPFVKFYDEVVISNAWRSAGINTRRFVDFLIHEHLSHGGKENGQLKGPYEQLEAFGVGARYLAKTIRDAEELGLVDCYRRGERVATMYGLTWLPLPNGKPATDRWRSYRNPKLKPVAVVRKLPANGKAEPRGRTAKSKNLPAKGKARLPAKGKADGAKFAQSACEREGRSAENLPAKGKVLSRRSYQEGAVASVVEDGERKQEPRAETCPWYVTDATGFRICKKPTVAGSIYCADHAGGTSRTLGKPMTRSLAPDRAGNPPPRRPFNEE
jgi:hypothetical protein